MSFERVGIIGTGLLGSSVGLALKAARPATQIIGFDLRGEHVRGAQKAKAIDRGASLRDTVKDAQLVVVATPVGAMKTTFEEIAPHLREGTVVTDTGSTKAQVLRWAEEILPAHALYVGGHPMAGRTETGPDAADAELFRGAVWCLVPSARASREVVDRVVQLVESIGAVPYFLDAGEHDGLVAAVSHLPHLLSVAFIGHLGSERSWRETASLAAGGFAYQTHLTDSDPRMFADIARTNRENIVRRIDLFMEELGRLRDLIAAEDPSLQARYERARELHDAWLSGTAQKATAERSVDLPSTRSMLAGGLFGGFGQKR